jgi:energy-converting hydrogenase Eha subunit H
MSTKNKLVVLIFILIFSLMLIFQQTAYALPTEWGKVNMSMTQLLNNGWQISAHSSNHVAVGNAGSANNYDNAEYTYLLTKGGRYITCIVQNPLPPIANVVACRSLN